MKIFKRVQIVTTLGLLLPLVTIAQVPVPLGASESFVLFSIPGPVGNTGTSFITGDVGTSAGSSTGFGNIDGQFKDGAAQNVATTAIVNANYLSLGTQASTAVLPVLFGNGQVLTPGVYEQNIASTLAGELILDGLNLPDPCFVIRINAAMSADPGASVKLINGAQACNVFWKIGGALNTGTGVTLKGNFFCDGAIGLATGCKLEGRAFSISGAVQVSSTTAKAPLGCGRPLPVGPIAPPLGAASCFSLLTGNGQLTNTGITQINGHVGTNNGPVTGFNPLLVDSIHAVPDAMTAAGTGAITTLYNTLIGLACDINMFDPAQFGKNLVLTPHVYCMGSATHLVDTIFLDAQGEQDAVFVFIISGAFTTATFANVVLRGGTKPSNVFWAVNGLFTVATSSNIVGTIVATGAITLDGSSLSGRAYSQNGAIIVSNLNLVSPSQSDSIFITGGNEICVGDSLQLVASASTSYLWSTGDTTQSIMVYNAGNYSVTGSSACGDALSSNSIIVTENLKYDINTNATICDGDSIFLAGAFRKLPGIYTDSLSSIKGCDSVIATNLVITPVFNTNINTAICEGDSIFLAGAFRKIAGTFVDSLSSSGGCDSVVSTNLLVNPLFITTQNLAICEGDSVFLAGAFRKTQGVYSDTLLSQTSCDSIINTNLAINLNTITNLSASICEGDSLLIAGLYRKISGTYIETLNTTFGCDSVINTTLVVNLLPIANAGNDTAILLGATVPLGETEVIGNTYAWSPALGLNQTNTAEVNANPTVTTTYILSVINDITGCSSTDTVVVSVSPVVDLEFFNGFSPNGDGFNDFWRIPVLSLYPSNSVLIISRWGSEVWETTNYDNINNVWTGKNMNGDELPDGSYFYKITYNGLDKTGWVFIKR